MKPAKPPAPPRTPLPPAPLRDRLGRTARDFLEEVCAVTLTELLDAGVGVDAATTRLERARLAQALLDSRGNILQAQVALKLAPEGSRAGTLASRLNRLHPDLASAAAELRAADGYTRGNPQWVHGAADAAASR